MSFHNIEAAAQSACENVGINFKPFPNDGVFHVVDATDGKKSNGAGRLKFFADGQGGIVSNWKTGQTQSFFINGAGEPTPPAELERIKREQQKRAAEQVKQQDRAARRAVEIWQSAKPAPLDHPYLIRKQIKPHTLRVASWPRSVINEQGIRQPLLIEDSLILPMYNAAGNLRSLQGIFTEKHPMLNRDKDFLPGGQLAGLFWWIGAKTKKVLIAEGAATAFSLHEETGHRVYMAFTANNLMAVGRIVREKLPDTEIVFCADNDTATAGNPGLTKATAAALDVGAGLAVPPIAGDFNDYAIFIKGAGNDK
ncbi:MAG: toprim domain-containing protein [Methylococcaceae bacterium]